MLIDGSGNVGIGTATPGSKLEVNAGTGGAGIAVKNGAGFGLMINPWDEGSNDVNIDPVSSNANVHFGRDTAASNWTFENGNVGIGTTAPIEKLEVAGNMKASGSLAGAQFMSSVSTGTPPLVVNSTTQVANLNASLLGGLPASAFGDITSVTAGTGLTGGATTGDAALALAPAARVRAITYLAGCDTCDVLTDADDQSTIFFNVIGSMTIASVTCFSDAGGPTINLRRQGSSDSVLSPDLNCSTSGETSTSFSGSENILNLNDKLDFIMVNAGGTAKRVTVAIEAIVD
ncbi:MAG: hypothetical protein HY313_04950, partial [Acidobacteria bacterium]|nr:hypothetical protein [Acidobacteriota bacterium]